MIDSFLDIVLSICYWLLWGSLGVNMPFIGTTSVVNADIAARMKYSWKPNGPVSLDDLRYLKVSHYDFNGDVALGELVVHKNVAEEVTQIFRKLYECKFPIEKMVLIDNYEANDEASMEDNNSSSFCMRNKTGSNDQWSIHSYGVAIDLNPKLNPYVKGHTFLPKNAEKYLDRTQDVAGMITGNSECTKIFQSFGWTWGGFWTSLKDYHHFEKPM